MLTKTQRFSSELAKLGHIDQNDLVKQASGHQRPAQKTLEKPLRLSD